MRKAVFQLESLTCPSCVKHIKNTLNNTVGVEMTDVLFNSCKVRIQFDEYQIEAGQIEKIIEKLGYPVLSTKVA